MTLTLIEVRDRLLSKTKYAHLPETNQWNKEMADAIDAHLATNPHSPDAADSGRVDLLNGEMLQAGADALDRFVAWESSNDEERYACIEAVWRAMQERAPTTALAAQGQGANSTATDTCRCGAPCRKEILMRGGDYGWGDDASRTVLRYVPPASPASPAGVPDGWMLVPEDIHPDDEIVDCSGIRNALNHRPGFRAGFSDELSLIATWWEQITSKSPEPFAAAPSAPEGGE